MILQWEARWESNATLVYRLNELVPGDRYDSFDVNIPEILPYNPESQVCVLGSIKSNIQSGKAVCLRLALLGPVLRLNTKLLLMLLLRLLGFDSYFLLCAARPHGRLWFTAIMSLHVEIDLHFVRDKVALCHIRVVHVPSSYQFADILTKGLPTALFQEFVSSLHIRGPTVPTAVAY